MDFITDRTYKHVQRVLQGSTDPADLLRGTLNPSDFTRWKPIIEMTQKCLKPINNNGNDLMSIIDLPLPWSLLIEYNVESNPNDMQIKNVLTYVYKDGSVVTKVGYDSLIGDVLFVDLDQEEHDRLEHIYVGFSTIFSGTVTINSINIQNIDTLENVATIPAFTATGPFSGNGCYHSKDTLPDINATDLINARYAGQSLSIPTGLILAINKPSEYLKMLSDSYQYVSQDMYDNWPTSMDYLDFQQVNYMEMFMKYLYESFHVTNI